MKTEPTPAKELDAVRPSSSSRMTLEEAEAYVRARRSEWLLLVVDVRTGEPTYTCPNCYRQRFTLVTKGAVLPERCPKCGVALKAPKP